MQQENTAYQTYLFDMIESTIFVEQIVKAMGYSISKTNGINSFGV